MIKLKFFSKKDVLVLPSIASESFPLVLLEALMFGVPILTSNNLGMKELVELSKLDPNTHLFSIGSAEDLIEKMRYLNSCSIKSFANVSRLSYLSYFTLDRLLDDIENSFCDEVNI